MNNTKPSTLRGLGVLSAAILAIIGLHFASRFGLSGPAGLSLDAFRDWAGEPVAVIATMARWISLMLAYYLAVVIGATLLLGGDGEATTIGRFTPASVTGLVGVLLGTSAVVVPVALHESPPADPAIPSVAGQNGFTDQHVDSPLMLSELDAPLTLQGQVSGIATSPVWNDTAVTSDSWIVHRGDSFWSIAEETLQDFSNTALSEEEIADYWRILIAANEDRLVEPGNPDLILPGQQLTLPPAPPRTASG